MGDVPVSRYLDVLEKTFHQNVKWNTVWYATTNEATTNECYNEQFLSIKSGCYNEHGGILSADVARACA